MTYIPVAGDQVFMVGRPATLVEVLAVDAASGTMWVRSQGGRPLTTAVNGWVQHEAQPATPETWHAVTPTAISRGFLSRALVQSNLPVDVIAVMHVAADATVTFDWVEAP